MPQVSPTKQARQKWTQGMPQQVGKMTADTRLAASKLMGEGARPKQDTRGAMSGRTAILNCKHVLERFIFARCAARHHNSRTPRHHNSRTSDKPPPPTMMCNPVHTAPATYKPRGCGAAATCVCATSVGVRKTMRAPSACVNSGGGTSTL